jgi:hypothetical protein
MMRGRRLGYVDFVKRHLFGATQRGESKAALPVT